LEQRTATAPAFRLVREETLRFGEKLDLRPWADRPLFMSVTITLNLMGRAATVLYQPHPLYMRLARDQVEERYRIVPSMAEQPFLVSPVLVGNYDVINLYASHPGKAPESVTFERPTRGPLEFRNDLTVRLYASPGFPCAARSVSPSRILADVQGRVFWPEPESVESATPARVVIFHGTTALLVHTPSRIVMEIPEKASSFSGYFGIPEEAYVGEGRTQGVDISITVEDQSGQRRVVLDRSLQPLSRAEDRGRFAFRVPVDGGRDHSLTLTTGQAASGPAEGDPAVWSQCRFEESHGQ
jgi:hypothetical protein